MPLLYTSFLGGAGGAAPPGDPLWDSVVLMAGFEGENNATETDDESPSEHGAATFFSAAKLTTSGPLVGASSLLLDGNVDRVSWPDHADWTQTGEFTIDVVCRFSSVIGGRFPNLIGQDGGPGSGNRAFHLIALNDADQFQFAISADGSSVSAARVDVAGGLQSDMTYHVRAHRDGSNVLRVSYRKLTDETMTIGGTTAMLAGMSARALPLEVGGIASSTFSNHVTGRVDEARITGGVARAIDEVVSLPFPRFAA